MENDKWHWQTDKAAWYGVGIYHVTITIPTRQKLLGSLIIPENDPTKAYVERTDLGKELIHALAQIPVLHPEIRLLQYCLMLDHLHAILYVTSAMPSSIKSVIRGFWQGAKKLGRAYVLSISPNTIRINEQNSSIFSEIPFIRPMSRRGQLDAMMQYVKLNPQRLATKQLNPGFFHVQHNVEINGRMYDAVGNIKLLYQDRYMPVHVRHTMVDEAEHGDDQRLRDYKNGCVAAARQGAVMVSPFINPHERDVLNYLILEQRPVIYLADNGFGQYYKPSAHLFDAVDAGRMLILSPWQHDPDKKHISRADCVALNTMAEEICCI